MERPERARDAVRTCRRLILSMLLLVRVTTRCNLACGFCAYDRRLPMPRTTLGDAQIERLIALLRDWQQRHRPQPAAMLSWLGGEPLRWPRWRHYSALARASGLRVSATSNGSTLWRPAERAAVLASLDELTLSVDAVGAAHDALRGWRGGYRRILEAITALRSARELGSGTLKLRANVVLMRSHIANFAALAQALAEAGIDEISCNLLGGRDRPEFHALERVSAGALQQFCAELPALRARLALRGVELLGGERYWARQLDHAQGYARPVADCAPGQDFVFCDEYARLSPCAFTGAEYGVDLAQIEALEDLPARFQRARLQQRAPACADCPSTQVFGKFACDVDLRASAAQAAQRPLTA